MIVRITPTGRRIGTMVHVGIGSRGIGPGIITIAFGFTGITDRIAPTIPTGGIRIEFETVKR